MITAKQAMANAAKRNNADEGDLRSIPEFKRMSQFVDGKIKSASKSGRHMVFLTHDEISNAGKLAGMKDFLLDALKDFLKENGFKVRSEFLANNHGFAITW